MLYPVFYYILSLLIVSFGQPAWMGWLGLVASICGFAIFWKALEKISSRLYTFLAGTLWFMFVQWVQLSWLTSYEYVGVHVLWVYFLLALGMGLQFGLLSLLLPKPGQKFTFFRILAISAAWVWMEWLRLHFICGFTWNPVGLALTASHYAAQTVSFVGIYGLSFWVMFVNLLVFKFFLRGNYKAIYTPLFCLAAALPFIYGFAHFNYWNAKAIASGAQPMNVLLVQTGLSPDQKLYLDPAKRDEFLLPLEQWTRILKNVAKFKRRSIDLIVLPEATVPFGAFDPVASYEDVKEAFLSAFGNWSKEVLPPLKEPLAQEFELENFPKFWAVGNGYWAQALANIFDAELVIGLEAFENKGDAEAFKSYQAGYHFMPYHQGDPPRYDKQVLVPMAEYLPFKWLRETAAKRGIHYFYTHGDGAKIFTSGKCPFGMAICYEETFGNLMRHNKLLGAQLLVNVSNDVWYPHSKLPRQHFDLGRLRAIENGIPLVRACNNGVTGAIDCFGKTIGILEEGEGDLIAGAVYLSLPTFHYQTIYTKTGDYPILFLSLVLILAEICACILSRRVQSAAEKEVARKQLNP